MFHEEIRITRTKIYFALFLILALILIGTLIFKSLEDWSYVDSFYFSTSTLTTVGYGDLVPTSDISKILASVYAILGVGTFLFCLSFIAEFVFYKRYMKINKKITDLKKKKK